MVEKLIITASGGPFRGRKAEELQGVTVEQALNHPTWSMGGKITIDSATLMNKGLEVIEAHHLFGTPYDRIDVVVHPQSIIHALVQLCDGSTKAHMGYPDMRVAIGYALHHPDRADLPIAPLDLIAAAARSTSRRPTWTRSRACAWPARPRVAGGTAPCVLNAANEVAVHAFLNGRLSFLGIPAVIEAVLDHLGSHRVHDFETLYVTDSEARAARGRADRDRGARMSWILAFLGFAALVDPARGRPLLRGQGRRHARRALLAVLPAAGRAPQAGRDRVRDRRDPARRLREDHRHEPGGGDPAGARRTAPTTASRCGSGSS